MKLKFHSLILIATMSAILCSINYLSYAYHEEWHTGPSCGNCHCEPGQDCYNEAFQNGCGCTNPEPSEGG